MDISVCIISKNELNKLSRCIDAIRKYPLEVVVVDTGSTDGTIEYIGENADVAGSFEWCNDFSKARNYSLSLASNDWVLILDSDEYIKNLDIAKLEQVFSADEYLLGRIELINIINAGNGTDHSKEHIIRLFNRKHYHFSGSIHEQIVLRDGEMPDAGLTVGQFVDVPVSVMHDGYAGSREELSKKADRNIGLLLNALEESADDPYILYQLGKSYFLKEDYENSAVYFEQGFAFDLDPELEYVQDMVETYGYALLELKRYEDMMLFPNIYNEFAKSADYLFITGLAYMNNGMWDKAIAEFEKATTMTYCKVEGCNSYKAYYNAGVICECLGRIEEARRYYEKSGQYGPAIEGLERVKADN